MRRVLWFSPLPPARTDVANYTARLVPFLESRVDLQLVHPDGAEVDPVYRSVEVAALSPRDLNQADACIYQLGNNARHHASIFRCAARHPGIVILHDRAINEFLLGMFAHDEQQGGRQASVRYREAMARWHGNKGERAAVAVLQGRESASALASAYPLYEAALLGALGAVCHNPVAYAELRDRFPKLPILTLPLPYPRPSTPPKTSGERDKDLIRLVMFGFMAPNRRLNEFLEAWSSSPYRDRFRLDLIGELESHSEFGALAKEKGLESQVHFHGFLPEEELNRFIAASDMVINLRNPTMGEASGSQLRIWANGAVSAVSDCGWYSLLPDDCVYKVGTETEADDVAQLVERLAHSAIDLAAMAAKGRERLAAHDPAQYSADLITWLDEQTLEMNRNWVEVKLMETVAQTYADCLPADLGLSLPAQLLAEKSVEASNQA